MSGHLSSSGNWACRANEPDKPRCPRTLNVSLFFPKLCFSYISTRSLGPRWAQLLVGGLSGRLWALRVCFTSSFAPFHLKATSFLLLCLNHRRTPLGCLPLPLPPHQSTQLTVQELHICSLHAPLYSAPAL